MTSSVDQPVISARTVEGSPALQLAVADQGDGTALVCFTPTVAGSYAFKLACGEGEECDTIPGTFKFAVEPAAVAPALCSVGVLHLMEFFPCS